MSCPASSNSRNFTVSAGSLPEGYCPTSWQEFLDDLAERLLVQSPLANSSFATGSSMPPSNVGPWLKNCEQWFFFDDATGLYVIQEKGGFDSLEVFTSSGSFTVPDDIYKILVYLWGAGGGGGVQGASYSAGAGAGAFGMKIFTVTPGQVIPVTIGVGGSSGSPGSNGGDSVVLTMTAGGGVGSSTAGGLTPGAGGTVTGADFGINGGYGFHSISGTGDPGSGGDCPMGGSGGRAGSAAAAILNGVAPGGGGCGGITGTHGGAGGSGGNGRAIIYY